MIRTNGYISYTVSPTIQKDQLANPLPVITRTPSVPSPKTLKATPRDPNPKPRGLRVTFNIPDSGLSNSLSNVRLLSKCVKNMSIKNEPDQKQVSRFYHKQTYFHEL
ncbi:unnamed protein product [Adineta ricciae]|uniref:Uncharacterized protein n=1 Tax=Adineta ricciae TaxID=249248 RepID=A0A814FVR0_ADIRI|nr:unnamed protein product [Adineta ricciae]CAF1449878.1 unnamed protein product [Adineta ricciae]